MMNYDFGVVFNIHESYILCGSFKISRQIEACRGQSNTASFLMYLVISDGLELNYFLWKEINENKLYMNNSNSQHLFCILRTRLF